MKLMMSVFAAFIARVPAAKGPLIASMSLIALWISPFSAAWAQSCSPCAVCDVRQGCALVASEARHAGGCRIGLRCLGSRLKCGSVSSQAGVA